MNPGFNFNTILYRSFIFLTCILLLLFFYKSKAHTSNATGKTIIHFSKTKSGKINVQIKAVKNSSVEFYLFNAAGELVEKRKTETKYIISLSGIKKGEYLYQCFEKDFQLKSGKLSVNKNSINYN